MTSLETHVKRYPNCRPSTLAYLQARDETTARLKAEIEEDRRRKASPKFGLRMAIKRLNEFIAGLS